MVNGRQGERRRGGSPDTITTALRSNTARAQEDTGTDRIGRDELPGEKQNQRQLKENPVKSEKRSLFLNAPFRILLARS